MWKREVNINATPNPARKKNYTVCDLVSEDVFTFLNWHLWSHKQTILIFFIKVSYQAILADVIGLRKGVDLVKYEREKQPNNKILEVMSEKMHIKRLLLFKLVISYLNSIFIGIFLRCRIFIVAQQVLLLALRRILRRWKTRLRQSVLYLVKTTVIQNQMIYLRW